MRSPPARVVPVLLFGIWILWGFGYETVWQRYATAVDGVIVSCHDDPSTGAPRYASEYVVRDDLGHDQTYVAGPTDASLERSLSVGTRIEKRWGQLGYRVNGEWIAFPAFFYSGMLAIALFCVAWALWQWRTDTGD
jgi:hypothetical protein